MQTPIEQQAPPGAAEHTNDLIKLVRKLRWMGMDAEAAQVEKALREASPADSVLAAPHDTD
jgi:hypothetical protein